MKHIFAICAYQESPYLASCIDSLKHQEQESEILLCTSTPGEYLRRLAEENGLEYCVSGSKPDIAGDWNFAMRCALERGADFVTLCHQDDLYLPAYGARLHRATEADPQLLIYFTDYGERRGEETVTNSTLLKIKRILLWRMRIPAWQKSRLMKHRTLAMGDPICCPSVTFNLKRIRLPLFESGMTTTLDWQTWERLALQEGRFWYDREVLMLHRIHPGSTTSKVLGEGGRRAQDEAMFRKFWPGPVAKLLTRLYAQSEKSNNL